jgi:iron(III) transport system substrate-binding protein
MLFIRITMIALPLALVGCVPQPEKQVVVYSALDREFAAPILGGFYRSTEDQIRPMPKFDVESTKTVGLVNRLIAEADQPVCDVFWNNEIMHTLRLQKLGLLQPHDWEVGPNWPAGMQASDGTWCGFAARARVLIVNTEQLPDRAAWPQTVEALADPAWRDRCAMAYPLFGTTATHAAVLDARLGKEKAATFFQQVADNALILSGNKQVALAVSSGQLAWGITDTDDAIIELEAGHPVVIVFPDQGEDQMGTLFIPNTVAIIKGGPNPEYARMLVDYLLSPAVEKRLAEGRSAQFPLGPSVSTESRVTPPGEVKWIEADFHAAADAWPKAAEYLREEFVTPK